jgi:hypothetical protein
MTDRTRAALADVDARLRRAASTLRSTVDEASVASPSLPTAPPHGLRRRFWLVAAAVVFLVAGSAVALVARESPQDSVRAVAGTDDYLVAGWLPDGFELVIAQRPPDHPSTLGLTFGRSSSADGQISVIQAPSGDEAGTLPSLVSADPEHTEVRGHRAIRVQDGPNTMLQWAERPGLVVTVGAEGVTDDELGRFVDELRRGRPGEIEDVLRQYDGSARLGDLAQGEILVAEGQNQASRWELVASDDVGQYGITLRDEAGASTAGTSKADLDGDGYISTTTGHAGGTPAVFGMVGPGVAEVLAEQPGTPTARLELLPIPGWSPRAFVMWPAGDPSDVVLVFRDGSGAEIGRSQ